MRKIAVIIVAVVLVSQCLASFAHADEGFWQKMYDGIKSWGTSSSQSN